MTAFLDIMAPSLAASVLLALIHAALGVHVLARGVIFADLALAQVAALGASVAYLRGAEAFDPSVFLWSFAFTLLGAALFSFFWNREHAVLQEAFIGITFALASAATILLLARAPHGAEHLQNTLSGGGILWLTWGDVGLLALLYGGAGGFLYGKRKTLWLCSTDPAAARRRGVPLRGWDFAFYAVFGLVVTSSVKVAGVLAVFAFLIMPVVAATLLGLRGAPRLLAAWGFGTAGSLLSSWIAYVGDLPTGATVVGVFGAGVAAVTLLRRLDRLHRGNSSRFSKPSG